MTRPDVVEHPASLDADPGRVIARLFLPGEGVASTHSRAADIVARVLALSEQRIAELADELVERFAARHADVRALFRANARAVRSRTDARTRLSANRELVLGACFTMEYSVEGAALCNPSAFPHPDQTGLRPGELRVAVALREIGEGHISSIGFAEAVVGDGEWRFAARTTPLVIAAVTDGEWSTAHLRAALEHDGSLNELSSALLAALPEVSGPRDIENALEEVPRRLLLHRDSVRDLDQVRHTIASAYSATFATGTELAQRVLIPSSAEEDHGMEDARFVVFTHDDGRVEYRATYTAYDGRDIAPRLILSDDLRTFSMHRLTGPAAKNKGMALFPRPVNGEHLAITRIDGERMSLSRSVDGLVWGDSSPLHEPLQPWEIVQTGNCGPPIETERGWLVLTHGVGPMRSYSLGAMLLDLDHPERVLALTEHPFVLPLGGRQDGYVPNVVYSCGAVVHDGRVWIPHGVGDARIGVVSVGVDSLLDAMQPVEVPEPASRGGSLSAAERRAL